MSINRSFILGTAAAGLLALSALSSPAMAQRDGHWRHGGWHDGWRGHHGWARPWGPRVYVGPPAIYAPPPVYYAPPPVYYAPPPPVVYSPGVTLGFNFR